MLQIKDESGKQIVEEVTITKDQTIREVYLDNPEKGWEMISSLKPVFRPPEKGGMVTAGNSSHYPQFRSMYCLCCASERRRRAGDYQGEGALEGDR